MPPVSGISRETTSEGARASESGTIPSTSRQVSERSGHVQEGLTYSAETNPVTPLYGVLILAVCCCSFTFFCNTE